MNGKEIRGGDHSGYERLAAAIPATEKTTTGVAPGFVLDPAWPKPLSHHWIIGDVGGIFVDRHNQIWVYHRPRSPGSSDNGVQGAAAKDAKGSPISLMGFPSVLSQIIVYI